MAELDYQSFQRRKRFKRKGTQSCPEISLGVTQLLITREELEIYLHRFEEFFTTLKFHIKNKAEFSASIKFECPRRDMLLEIGSPPARPLPSPALQSAPSDQGSWGSSLRLGSERGGSRQSLFSFAHSPICSR